jgi:uncharacterized membrane protein
MLPDPLHPALVHIPVALVVLAPLVALLAILSIRRGFLPVRSWAAVVLMQALLLGSTWLAVETGERDEEAVERFVAERHIEAHEEAAERMLWLTVATFGISMFGLSRGRWGTVARLASFAAGLAVLASGFQVGHSGGELVYRHGAASAHVERHRAPAAPEVGRPTRPE